MLKQEFEFDANIIEELGYSSNGVFESFIEVLTAKGLILEKFESGYFLFRGPGLNTDLSYIALAVKAVADIDVLKRSCKKMTLLDNEATDDGSFYESDWIKLYKENGMW